MGRAGGPKLETVMTLGAPGTRVDELLVDRTVKLVKTCQVGVQRCPSCGARKTQQLSQIDMIDTCGCMEKWLMCPGDVDDDEESMMGGTDMSGGVKIESM